MKGSQFLAAVAALAFASVGQAAVLTWNAADGTSWTAADAWLNGGVAATWNSNVPDSAQFTGNATVRTITGTVTQAGITIASGSTLTLQTLGGGSNLIAGSGAISGDVDVKATNGILFLASTGGMTGNLTISNGRLALNALGCVSSGTLVDIVSGAQMTLNKGVIGTTTIGELKGDGTVTTVLGAQGGNRVLDVNQATDTTFAGTLTQEGSTSKLVFIKSGVGSLTLTGDNSYTGGTTINGGTLVVGHANALGTAGTITNNAVLAIAGGTSFTRDVTWTSGATLAGLGEYKPATALTLAGGVTVSPGIGDIGALAIAQDLALQGKLFSEVGNSGTADLLRVYDGATGMALDLSSDTDSIEISFVGSTLAPGVYTLAEYGSLTGKFDSVTWTGIDTSLVKNYSTDSGLNYGAAALTFEIVPEPGTLAMLAAGLLGLLAWAWRKRN